jgi:hypothetical protein
MEGDIPRTTINLQQGYNKTTTRNHAEIVTQGDAKSIR